MSKFKVGQVIKAISDEHVYTTKSKKWVGKIIDIAPNGQLIAETISCSSGSINGEVYRELYPENFAPYIKTLEDIEVGDILIDNVEDERFVMGVAGKMVWLSANEEEAECDGETSLYTMLELKENGYKVKGQESEIMEISMDEVAKKFGKSTSEIRIKKE